MPDENFAQELAKAIAEQSACICQDFGILGKEWLYQREPQCSCEAGTEDFDLTFHDIQCDTVPCPFCVLTGKIELHP